MLLLSDRGPVLDDALVLGAIDVPVEGHVRLGPHVLESLVLLPGEESARRLLLLHHQPLVGLPELPRDLIGGLLDELGVDLVLIPDVPDHLPAEMREGPGDADLLNEETEDAVVDEGRVSQPQRVFLEVVASEIFVLHPLRPEVALCPAVHGQ